MDSGFVPISLNYLEVLLLQLGMFERAYSDNEGVPLLFKFSEKI